MDSFTELQSKTVPELKKLLQDRGISCSEYRKDKLLRLVQFAFELNLEVNDLSDDSEDALLKRITIDFNGTSRTLPKPCDQLLEWKQDLKILPDINLGRVFAYILTACGWDTNRLQNYKDSNGFQLFEKDHIFGVTLWAMV